MSTSAIFAVVSIPHLWSPLELYGPLSSFVTGNPSRAACGFSVLDRGERPGFAWPRAAIVRCALRMVTIRSQFFGNARNLNGIKTAVFFFWRQKSVNVCKNIMRASFNFFYINNFNLMIYIYISYYMQHSCVMHIWIM